MKTHLTKQLLAVLISVSLHPLALADKHSESVVANPTKTAEKQANKMPSPVVASPEASTTQTRFTYKIDSGHTYPHFEVSHMGFSLQRGQFDTTTGTVILDRINKTGSIDITIDTKSINTGHAERDKHLRAESLFHVDKYPTMTYRADKLQFDGDVLVGAMGTLTLRGISKEVPLTIRGFNCGRHAFFKQPWCGADASAEIKRSDFGMSYGIPKVGDTVKITIQIEAGQETNEPKKP